MCILASAGGFGYIGLICGYTEFICGYFADIQDSVVTERVICIMAGAGGSVLEDLSKVENRIAPPGFHVQILKKSAR